MVVGFWRCFEVAGEKQVYLDLRGVMTSETTPGWCMAMLLGVHVKQCVSLSITGQTIIPFTFPPFLHNGTLKTKKEVLNRFEEEAKTVFASGLTLVRHGTHQVTGCVATSCITRDRRLVKRHDERRIIAEVLGCNLEKVVSIGASGEVGFMEPAKTCSAALGYTADQVKQHNTRLGVDPGRVSGFFIIKQFREEASVAGDGQGKSTLDDSQGMVPADDEEAGAGQNTDGDGGAGQEQLRGEMRRIAPNVDIMLVSNGRACIIMCFMGPTFPRE
jgi:hypothetical protein